jgi:hypothetical protein
MTYMTDPTARALHAFLQRWLREHPLWAYSPRGWYHQLRSVSDIASELLQDAEFGEVKLASWLQSPDGVLIQTVVGWVLPQPHGAEFKLMVAAISSAAQARQDNERGLAGVLTLVAGAMLALLLFSVLRSQESHSA